MNKADKMMTDGQNDIVKWDHAVELQNKGDFEETLKVYDSMYELTPAHLFNMSLVHVCLGNGNSAVKCLTAAAEKDPHFAVAFYLRGIVHFDANNFSDAITDFQHTKKLLRGNRFINYRPIGLRYHLQLFEILYNLALARFAKGDIDEAGRLLTEAIHDTDDAQRKYITEAFKLLKENKPSLLKPFRISTDKIFVPPKEVIENLARQHSAKGSKLVFTSDKDDDSTCFVGTKRVEQLRQNRRSAHRFTSLKLKPSNELTMKKAGLKRSHSTGSLITNHRIHVRQLKSSVKQKNEVNNNNNNKNLVTSTPMRSVKANESTDVLNTAFNGIEKTPNNTPGDGLKVCEKAVASDISATTEKSNPQPEQKPIAKTMKGSRSFKRVSHKTSMRSKTLYGREGLSRSMSDIVHRKQHKTQKSRQFYSNRSTDNRVEIKDVPFIEPVVKRKTSFKSSKKQSLNITKIGDVGGDFVDGHKSVVMSGGQSDYTAQTAEVCEDRGPKAAGSEQTKDGSTTLDEKTAVEEKPSPVKQKLSFKRRKTLGSVFGDKSTAVKYALTEACNVLTAFVTPIVDESEIQATSVLLKHHRKRASASKSILSKQEGQIFDPGKTKSIKSKRAPDPPKPFIGQSLLAVSNLITSVIDQDLMDIKTEEYKSNDANSVHLGKNICCKDAAPTTDGSTWPPSTSNGNNVGSRTGNVTEDLRIINEIGTCASLDARKKEEDQSKAISFELETEITRNPVDNYVASNIPVNAEYGATTEILHNQQEQELVRETIIDQAKNELGNKAVNMDAVSESTKCKSAKAPPDYPPPPLRLSFKKNKNAAVKKEQNSKVKDQTHPKAVDSALFAAGKTVSMISSVGTTPNSFVTAAFEEAERFKLEISKHDYVNFGHLNIPSDVNVDYVNIRNLQRADEIYAGNDDDKDHSYVNVGRRSEDDDVNIRNLQRADETYAGNDNDKDHSYVNVGRRSEDDDVNIRNLQRADETYAGNDNDGDHAYVNVGRRSEDEIPLYTNADEDQTVAKEYYANWNRRSSEAHEVPYQFSQACNEHCQRQIETREIELDSGTFTTTCQLLGDFVNSSQEISDAFKAFIQNENNNNNLVWCVEGHLRNVDERAVQSKSLDYINVNQFSTL